LNESTAGPLNALKPDEAVLILPQELKNTLNDRIDGTGADTAWWSEFGIAAGAVLARCGALAPLTTMIDTQPTSAPSIIHRYSERLSNPRTATLVVAAVVLVLALSPIIFNGLRLGLLKLRYSSLDERLAQVQQAQQSLTMYEELEEQAWPMTKLLADIANCTPLGIELDIIRIRQGQFFTVAGKASPRDDHSATELVSMMERQLRDTGIFTDVVFTWKDPTALNQYEFDMTAKITRPHYSVHYDVERDFGRYTHEMRRNGDPAPTDGEQTTRTPSNADVTTPAPIGARASAGDGISDAGRRNPVVEPGPSTDDKESTGPVRESRATQGGRSDDRDLGVVGGRGEGTRDPSELPEFLSESTIATLSKQETIDRLSKVANAKRRWKDDKETMDKLNEQWKLLMDQLKTAS
jgi:Tfp pilus assembly protein PilN